MKKNLLLLIISITAILTSCNNQDKNVVKIGGILSLTGDNALQGNLALNGAMIAIDEINEKGGIKGKKVELIVEDSKTTSSGTINAFKKITSLNNVTAMISTGDIEFQAINTVADKTDKLIMATTCSGMIGDGRSHLLFRYCFNEESQDDILLKFVHDSLKVREIALIYPNNLWGKEIDKYTSIAAKKHGVNIVNKQTYDINSMDQKTVAMKALKSNPQIICIRGFGTAFEAVLRHLSELNYSGTIIGDITISLPGTINNTKKAVEGAFLVSIELNKTSDNPVIQKYTDRYRKKYDTEPCFWDALGYDACMYLIKAIEKGEIDNSSISEALFTLTDIDLLLGKNTFKDKSDVDFEMSIFKIENNKSILIE